MKVLNFGSLNLDYVYDVDHFVREGETISSTDMNIFCGGKGLNQSVALAKAGVPYELHIFNKGKHGLVLGDLRTGVKSSNQNAQVYKWVDLFLEWLAPIKTIRAGFYKPIDE